MKILNCMAKYQHVIFLRIFIIQTKFLHTLPDEKELFEVIARERSVLPAISVKQVYTTIIFLHISLIFEVYTGLITRRK